jgi:hypothetical protein
MGGTQAHTVHVYDTWVRGKKGLLHFDVMTTDEATALKLAKQYLDGLGEYDVTVTLKECQFCHSEPLVMFSAEQQKQFKEHGGFILPLPA